MSLLTDKDIEGACRTRWAAAAVLNALIPAARVYADRIAEKTAWPAALLRVTEGEITRMGSANYLRAFRIEVVAECRTVDGDAEAIRSALSGAFGGTAADSTAGLTVSGATVLHCLEADGGGIRPKPAGVPRQDGSDLLRVVSEFDLMIHGSN
jgi:hypothetical protein